MAKITFVLVLHYVDSDELGRAAHSIIRISDVVGVDLGRDGVRSWHMEPIQRCDDRLVSILL